MANNPLYKTKAWLRLRAKQLREEPLCKFCEAQGLIRSATVVDHIKAHKNNLELFHDPDNLQSLCKSCHDGRKQRQEKRGYSNLCDSRGFPIDKNHPANKK